MSILITSDLHFTDNLLDSYRWGLFPWLEKEISKNNVSEVYILGDLTEKKDHHSSVLVNRLISELRNLSRLAPIFILMGNHDFIDRTSPFFHFLDGEKNISFVVDICGKNTALGKILFIPYQGIEGYSDLKDMLSTKNMDDYDYILIHDSVLGAKLSSGIFLNEGMPPAWFSKVKSKIFSGHIHIPQVIGNVEYIGSPYPVYFGDSYKGRAVIISTSGKFKDIYYPCLKRDSLKIYSLKELFALNLKEGDQIKIKFLLGREEFSDWSVMQGKVKEWCLDKGIILCSLELVSSDEKESFQNSESKSTVEDSSETLERFAKLEGLDHFFKKAGLSIMDIEL